MNIVVLAGSLAHTEAGAAHATLDFCNALAASTGHRVTVYTTACDPDAFHPSLRVVRYQRPDPLPVAWRLKHLTAVGQYVRELRRHPWADVDLCYTQSLALSLAFRELRPQVPIISHTGAVISERERVEELGGARPPWYIRADAKLLTRLERRSYRQPRWTHVVSTKSVARQRAAFYGVDETLFSICPYGLSLQKFDRATAHEDARQVLQIPRDAPVLLTVSRLIKWKNTDMLLRAFARCGVEGAWLIVAGGGPERPRLEALARELGISDRVRFTGHVANPASLYAAADLFALPSQIESFGIVYGEAMLMGLPCIGLRSAPPHVLSSAEDVIVDGTTGFCVADEQELTTRLAELLSDREGRRRFGDAGYTRARQLFSCETYLASILALARAKHHCAC